MKKSLSKILSIFFSGLLLFSCTNLLDDNNSGYEYNFFEKVNISGTIGVKGAVPSSIANARSLSAAINGRTAIPTIPEGADYYFFKTRDLDSGEVDNAAGLADSNGSYSVGLIIGRRFEITAGISSDTEHENVILSTSWETPLVTRENAASLGKNIILAPENESEGEGTVKLSMIVASSINSVSCDNSLFTVSGTGTLYTVENTGTKIRCGAHSLTFTFLDESGHLLFYNTQIINVFPNMETNKWVSGGGSLDPIDADGDYNVTTTLIEKFARSQIYVGTTPLGTASSAGIGSVKSPFASFMQAIDYITNKGDATIDYTIWVSGEIKETGASNVSIGTGINSKAHSITICGTKGNAYDSLNGNKSGTVLSISTSVPVTIKDLKITNGSADSGGGINMTGGAKVTLESGALIGDETEEAATSTSFGNKASSNGGGIYISNGTLILKKGSKVAHNYGCINTHTDDGSGGGGIFCDNGSITLEKGSAVSYNATNSRGGGIDIKAASGKSVLLTINGGEISLNEAFSYGGGIYIGGGSNEINMTSGKILGNKSKEDARSWGPGGGALFMDGGKFTMTGDSEISNNTAEWDAGGIFLVGNCELNLLGGKLENNYVEQAEGCGGAIKIKDNANKLNIGGSIQIPYNSGKNDITLSAGKYITITKNITSPSPVATINMETWSQGASAIVVKADGTNVNDLSTISDITNMFVCSEEKYSTVLSDDKKSLYLDAPIYVSKTVTNAAASKGTKANPYDSIASAISSEMNDKNTDYLIYVVGELTESQTIADTFTKASNAKSLTIKGYDDTAVLNGAGSVYSPLLSINTDVPLTIMNLTITGGENSGIKIEKVEADVTLGNGSKITGNKGMPAGGIYNNMGTVKILSGAEISNNESYTSNGGGIYNYFGIVTMEGGIISENSGVGIFNYKTGDSVERVTTFEMNGGTISGNTGPAVYNEGVVKISGNAYIPAGTDDNNVVDLAVDTKILITGSLTPPEEAKGTVATIKPSDYNATLLSADTGVTLANEIGKFRIIPQSSGSSLGTGLEYGLDTTGKYSTDSVMVVPGDNDMDEIKTAIRTLISSSTEPVNLCFTSDFNPVGASSDYAFTISGKTVNITATKPVTLTLNATYHYQQFFKVTGGGKLTLGNNITLKGNNNGLNYAVYLDGSGSELILDGAKITNWKYDGGGAIVYVASGTVLRIKGNTEIYKNRSIINVKGGTVYMEGGAIYNNDLENITRAVIIIQGGGKFIKSGGRIYGNKGYRNGLSSKQSQVKFEAYKWYKGGYWGPSEDSLTAYNMEDSGDEDKNKEELYFNSESDVNNQRTSTYSNYN